MTDEELGRQLMDAYRSGSGYTDMEIQLAKRARTLLAARPTATREAVDDEAIRAFLRRLGRAPSEIDSAQVMDILAALSHFAPPPAPLPISGMSVEDIERIMREDADIGPHAIHVPIDVAARVAHRLAQPAPVVDPDAEAKRLASAWTDIIHTKKRYSVPWDMMDETTKNAWRAVAAAKERGE